MRNSFAINQQLTFGELLRSRLHFYLSGKLLKILFASLIGLELLSIFIKEPAAIAPVGINNSIMPLAILMLIVVSIGCVISFYLYNTQPYLGNTSYRFSEEGITIQHGATESRSWQDISRFEETRLFFLLYITNNDVHIIQKRMFVNSKEREEFRQLLNRHINR